MHTALNAWREILARVFEGFMAQSNVSPEWLVNPATKRRLKLDLYYPEAGVAVRFVGLTAKGQGRQSDWEVMEEEQRDQTRVELCQQHAVQLMLVEPLDDPVKQIDTLIRHLTRAGRVVAQSSRPDQEKAIWQPRISAARDRGEEVRRLVARHPDQMMANLSDRWRDRELAVEAAASVPAAPRPMPSGGPRLQLQEGQRVAHTKFGEGVVTALTGDGDDTRVTILFDGDQARTFLLALVHDKLTALR